jgi:flagellar motor protein MotB
MNRQSRVWAGIVVGMAALAAGGCAVRFSQRSPWDIRQIQTLSDELDKFRTLARLKSDEADRLRDARKRLSSEIGGEDISVGFDERGLVVRMLDRVLFDSGKAQLRQEAYPVLDKVAKILKEELAGQPIGVEGHTDNEPIRKSGWKDNWELSMARSRSVLTYLVKNRGVNPAKISAGGYGEYRPIASNDTADGRRMNRRVEIVVLPKSAKVEAGPQSATEAAAESAGTTFTK